ncbi:MAG: TAXI family TRAP transporter solute-binding subunit [Gammaproteobacteria bacterium]|nr:TAXI family TRAP transporter solute-binding subunit [Gammaproteobacteria bacterium]MDP2141854.1 TAXI family TRAP transporter solute-binding subunit [Gammaproteobacteria bacterium]MDP2348345.1 TAXI family TRAP transporter solute-binding subunit [Gammaproteobacteria bacterium]
MWKHHRPESDGLQISGLSRGLKRLVVAMCASALLTACSEELSANRPYILTTATVGGAYYPIGVAMATISKSQLQPAHNVSLSAISSAGSLENVKLLRDNEAQFAIIQGVFAAWAWNGEGPIRNPQTEMRSVSAMWFNVEHFVLLTNLVKDGTLSDFGQLRGERVVLGARNSGAEQTGRYILEQLGIDYESAMTFGYMGYEAAAGAMQDGNVVGINVPAGAPASAITQAFAQMGNRITLLSFSQEELDTLNSRYPLWDWYDFAPGTYPNQTETLRSIASPNVLVVRDDIPDEHVYLITKMIWENLGTMQDIHAATKDMKFEAALKGLAAPLHPGALRYYRERGLEIPDHLLLAEQPDQPQDQ